MMARHAVFQSGSDFSREYGKKELQNRFSPSLTPPTMTLLRLQAQVGERRPKTNQEEILLRDSKSEIKYAPML